MDDQVLIHILETACAEENLIFQVIEQERHLHVFLNREAEQVLDYQAVGRKIFQAFSRLSLTDIDGVCLYSRVLGQEEPDWEAKFRLPQAKQAVKPAAAQQSAQPGAAQQATVQQVAQPVAQAQQSRAAQPAQTPAQQRMSEAATYIMQDETEQAGASRTSTAVATPVAEAAAYPLSDTDGAAEAAADYEAAEAAAPTVSVVAESAIAHSSPTPPPTEASHAETSAQSAPAPLEQDFDLASHCFIRNRMLLTADIVPPAKGIAQQLDAFHKFDLVEKQRMMPQLELFFKGAPTFSTDDLGETQQQWFQAMEALGGDKKRKAAIWFSRYCVDPETTLAVVAKVFDPSLGGAEPEVALDSPEPDAEPAGSADEAGPRGMDDDDLNGMGMNCMSAPPRRSAQRPPRSAPRTASQAQASQSFQPAAQSQPASSVPAWFFPGIVVAGSIFMILLGLIFARPATVAASDLCNGSAEQEYCQLATKVVDGEVLEEVLDYTAPLPDDEYERDRLMGQAIANCNPFGAMNAGENFIKAFDKGGPTPVNSAAREVMPGIILADVQHANVDSPGDGDVRTACLLNYASLGGDGGAWEEAVPMGDVVIPTAWPEVPFESGEGYAEQVRQARAENILVRVGANLIFTAMGMFAAVMLRTAITAYSVDVLCQATIVMCIIETVLDAIVPFGIFSTFAGKSLALGLTSAIVPNFKLDWSNGYFAVLACVMVMSLVRLVCGWILFASILQGGLV